MTEIMPVPRNLNFTVLPAGSYMARFFIKHNEIAGTPKASLGHKGSWPEGPEGIRTSQISVRFDICNKSPPSFSPKMPPPLIMQGITRGGVGACDFRLFYSFLL